ncbi:MAG: type II secretion system F family protein [Comamonadaceae bacterium]|nr:MAG: type II secretion system F family protein [Comamonadaceae bacterium]
MNLTPTLLTALSLGLLALALLALAGGMVAGELRRARSDELIRRAIKRSAAAIAEGNLPGAASNTSNARIETGAPTPGATVDEDKDGEAQRRELPLHWLDTRLGRALVGDEDRRLLDQSGFSSLRAQWIFLVSRAGLAVVLPLLGWIILSVSQSTQNNALILGVAFFAGFMAPKWLMRRRAKGRREQAEHELPLFVDLLRLLQGVGLSLDQTLQIMAAEFMEVLPVLGHELEFANRQYSQGRSREHSLQRLATLFDNEDMAGLVSLLVQVDRHGGAVQEPLRIFSDRLRESRRNEMREKIGKITVKMTVIMICTLLPALIIVTAGPGFLAVIRSVGSMSR